MSKNKLKIYSGGIADRGLYNNRSIIVYGNYNPKKEIYSFKYSDLFTVSREVIDKYKLSGFVYGFKCIVCSAPKPVELSFDVLCETHNQIKSRPFPFPHNNRKCLELYIELLELIMINYDK